MLNAITHNDQSDRKNRTYFKNYKSKKGAKKTMINSHDNHQDLLPLPEDRNLMIGEENEWLIYV